MKKVLYGVLFVGVLFFVVIKYSQSKDKILPVKIELPKAAVNTLSLNTNQYIEDKAVQPSSEDSSAAKIEKNTLSSVSTDDVWALHKLNPEVEQSIRNKFNIDHGIVEGLNIKADLIGNLVVDDVINLNLPSELQSIKIKITSTSTDNNIKTIVGVIDGLSVGYGITFSYGSNMLVGDIISDHGSWSIDTISGVTFITNGRKSEGLEHDSAQ